MQGNGKGNGKGTTREGEGQVKRERGKGDVKGKGVADEAPATPRGPWLRWAREDAHDGNGRAGDDEGDDLILERCPPEGVARQEQVGSSHTLERVVRRVVTHFRASSYGKVTCLARAL